MRRAEALLRLALGVAQIAGAAAAVALYRDQGPTWSFVILVVGTSVAAASSAMRFHRGAWRFAGVALAGVTVIAAAVLATHRDGAIVPQVLAGALDAIVPGDASGVTPVSYDAGRFEVTGTRDLETNVDQGAYLSWVGARLGGEWHPTDASPDTFVRTAPNDAYSITFERHGGHMHVIGIARAE